MSLHLNDTSFWEEWKRVTQAVGKIRVYCFGETALAKLGYVPLNGMTVPALFQRATELGLGGVVLQGPLIFSLSGEGKEYMYRVREQETVSFQDQDGLACHKTRRHVISTNEQNVFDAILRVFANSEEQLMRIEILGRLGRVHDNLQFLGERNPLTGIRLQMIRMTESRYVRIVKEGGLECGPTFALATLGQERWEKIKGVASSVESMTAAILDRIAPVHRERTLADRVTLLEAKARKNYALCQRLRGNLVSLAEARKRLRETLESLPKKE